MATINKDKLFLQGFVSDLHGSSFFRSEISGKQKNSVELGKQLAIKLLNQGAQDVLEEIYREQRK